MHNALRQYTGFTTKLIVNVTLCYGQTVISNDYDSRSMKCMIENCKKSFADL